jgi:CheY-like chemotaxis protein
MPEPVGILLVDDCEDDVFLFKYALSTAGLELPLIIAPDGAEAMEFLRKAAAMNEATLPKVVLTDLKMPRASGFDLLAFLRSDPVFSTLIPIVWSNSTEHCDVRDAYELGARCYLQKPSNQESWRLLIERVNEFYNGCRTLSHGEATRR